MSSGSIRNVRRLSRFLVAGLTLVLMTGAGCSTVRITDPSRTATEQFLLSGAAAEAVNRLNFDTLRGRTVYVEDGYFGASEKEFVIGLMRARMLLQGVRIAEVRENAEVVLEVRSGGVGIDRYGFLIGLPASVIPASVWTGNEDGSSYPVATPELSLLKNVDQRALAGVAYVAYWRDTGEVVATSGPYVGRAFRDDWWYFGVGPNSNGDIPPVRRTEGLASPGTSQPTEQAPPPDEGGS